MYSLFGGTVAGGFADVVVVGWVVGSIEIFLINFGLLVSSDFNLFFITFTTSGSFVKGVVKMLSIVVVTGFDVELELFIGTIRRFVDVS